MAPPGGDGEVEKTPLRWLDAVRYAAASMVTVLITTVVQGSISGSRGTNDRMQPILVFDLNLRIDNPRRRARMYFVHVTAYLFDNDTPASSSNPEEDSFVFFGQDDKAVQQQSEVNYFLQLTSTRRQFEPKFFDLLYYNDDASMSGVTMRLDASLVTEESTSGFNTSRAVTYYCWPLVVVRNFGAVGEDLGDDVFCREVQGSHFI